MSINQAEYFRWQVQKWDKEVLEAQDGLVKIFETTGDANQLRKDFYELRWNYLEKCLTTYTVDLVGTELAPEQHRTLLLQTKLAFYVTRFDEDTRKLFPKQPLRNGYMIFRFARAGNKLVTELGTAHDPFTGL
jgi:hypothetical protein